MSIRRYSELIRLHTFEERYRYLCLHGYLGKETFGVDRWLNQNFYHNDPRWKSIRSQIIVRDCGLDLGVEGREIFGPVYVHHMNPVTVDELLHDDSCILDPEFLICTSFATHNAIHFGSKNWLMTHEFAERSPNDTCPWKKKG